MFQTACCLCNNEVEPVWVGTNSYASLILVELAPGCCLQKHVCRLNLSWWMFKRYEHVHIYIYTYIHMAICNIYICLYMSNVCIVYAPTYVPPTDCRRPQVPWWSQDDTTLPKSLEKNMPWREVHHLLMNGEQTGDFLLI